MTNQNLEKDFKFLKEMYQCSQELLNNGFDLVILQHLDKMIEDWKDELETLKKKTKK